MNLMPYKIWLNESWGTRLGDVSHGDETFSVRKADHLNIPRGSSSIPRHGGLSDSKLLEIVSNGLSSVSLETAFVITFPKSNYYGGLVGIKVGNTIRIITVMISKTNTSPDKIQPRNTNRTHITLKG